MPQVNSSLNSHRPGIIGLRSTLRREFPRWNETLSVTEQKIAKTSNQTAAAQMITASSLLTLCHFQLPLSMTQILRPTSMKTKGHPTILADYFSGKHATARKWKRQRWQAISQMRSNNEEGPQNSQERSLHRESTKCSHSCPTDGIRRPRIVFSALITIPEIQQTTIPFSQSKPNIRVPVSPKVVGPRWFAAPCW